MAGSTFGTIFKISTWGESHGKAIGTVIDGCPAGLALTEEEIQKELDRRKPGQNRYTSARREADQVEILSGTFEGVTTGTPISLIVRNTDAHSQDYRDLADVCRPGHADYTYDKKYGVRDYRGGGRASARETIGRVAAGAVAKKLLSEIGVHVQAYVSAVGPVEISRDRMDLACAEQSSLRMPDPEAEKEALAWLDQCMENQDSSGGVVTCMVTNLPAGLGEPVFEKLDANLAKALMSIGAVKAVEIGDGTAAGKARGSENNDTWTADAGGAAQMATNHCGGILGGISDGAPLLLRATFKPTPSIAQPQKMYAKDGTVREQTITGRHDPLVAARAVPVVEAMTALTLADHLLIAMSSRMENIKNIYL